MTLGAVADRIILWTRITPRTVNVTTADYNVTWNVYSGEDLATVVRTGTTVAQAVRDYTVKVSSRSRRHSRELLARIEHAKLGL